MGSFEEWSDLVRQALIWAGEDDPNEGRKNIEAESDPQYEHLATLQQFPEAVGTLSSPCLFISRYVKLKPHPARLSSFPIGGFYGNRGT